MNAINNGVKVLYHYFDMSCYRPQRSWGKVMFLHVSVILFTGGGRGVSVSVPGGLCHGDPPYGNEWTVRILLECILVTKVFHVQSKTVTRNLQCVHFKHVRETFL